MKKAQDFLVDTTLGDKSYGIEKPKQDEEKIILSIEEGAIPVSMLKEVAHAAEQAKKKSFYIRINDFLKSLGKPAPKDKATFFRLLSIMINAGIPLIKSLDTIAEQTMNHRLKTVVFEIARDIEKGGTFSRSMTHYPDVFSESHIGMIRAGEASGQLNRILKELAIEVEKTASITRKVKGAMMYPVFIIVVMIVVVVAMLVLVVPKIAEIFTESGRELPLLTRIVIAVSDFLRMNGLFIFAIIIAAIAGFFAFRRTQQGKAAIDWLLLHIPIFGFLFQKSILARFSRSLANLLSSGVPIIEGLLINAKGLGNEVYRKRVELASEDIARGIPLAESLRDSPEFPSMMVQMISVGEQTAQLDSIAVKIAEYYEEEVDVAVAGISKVIEPLILIVVGVVVGGIIGAVMMPIIQLTQLTGSI